MKPIPDCRSVGSAGQLPDLNVQPDMHIAKLLSENEVFNYWFTKLCNNAVCDPITLDRVLHYADRYIAFYGFSAPYINASYLNFINRYIEDIEKFVKTNEYPLSAGSQPFHVSRSVYDLVLMLSILFTVHRFRIMQLVRTKSEPVEEVLVVGLGSGIEIDLIKESAGAITAFDLSVSDFCKSTLTDVTVRQAYFTGDAEKKYDRIYLIEILEHLESPYELLEKCAGALTAKGQIFATTATDIPQFDHLYNFSNLDEFEKRVQELGLKLSFREDIPHEMSFDIGAKNTFYIWSRPERN